jgi:hypothetical protein
MNAITPEQSAAIWEAVGGEDLPDLDDLYAEARRLDSMESIILRRKESLSERLREMRRAEIERKYGDLLRDLRGEM